MATQAQKTHPDAPDQGQEEKAEHGEKRSRLTLDLDPELHARIKMVAAANGVSMREFVENILQQTIPAVPRSRRIPLERWRPISRANVEILDQVRRQVMRGRVFTDDSADLLHEARDERLESL
jgi:predicted DNA binding CopG/RHH family protein